MGIRPETSILIQGAGNDIVCDGVYDPATGKYAGWITLRMKGEPHIQPLVSSPHVFDTREEAMKMMEDFVQEIRETQK